MQNSHLLTIFTTYNEIALLPGEPPPPTETQATCRVRLPDLAGSYEGECHRGRAHGQGKAIGRDTYEGEFAKGLPHGHGTYTWANGGHLRGRVREGCQRG